MAKHPRVPTLAKVVFRSAKRGASRWIVRPVARCLRDAASPPFFGIARGALDPPDTTVRWRLQFAETAAAISIIKALPLVNF